MSKRIYSTLEPTTSTHNFSLGDEWCDDSGNLYEYLTPGWVQTHNASGAALVSGLAPTASRLTAGTYNTTNILGVRILTIGTGTLTLSPASGDTDIVITAAELTAMGANAYLDWTVPTLDSVTAGTGMSVMLLTR